MTKTKKLDMELPKEGRFISSEFPILRENLTKIDQAIMEVEEKVEGKAPSKHTHTISDVADLEATLKGKMAADKTFTFADLTDIEGAKDAANNYVLYKSSNNNFTFGSAISLLGAHQHKTEDIVGLDEFRAKINEDLTSYYGRLKQANEWQNYNKFTSKVTMSGGLELLGNSSFNLIHNGEIVTSLSTTGSFLKGPLKVDGDLVCAKPEIDALQQEIWAEMRFLRKCIFNIPIEIQILESGKISWPSGVTDDTVVQVWAWGAGGGGDKTSGYGGGGGECVIRTLIRKDFYGHEDVVIGKGGHILERNINPIDGGNTIVGKQLIVAEGGKTATNAGCGRGGGITGGQGENVNKGISAGSSLYGGGGGGLGRGSGGNSFYGGGGGAYGRSPGLSKYGGRGGGTSEKGQVPGGGGGYVADGGDGMVLLKIWL
ncbi:Bgr_08870 family protein [Bartonella taylorii]|uniref:Bgr_08870 family protein n=1 Tax=Bartonella taylorii TaxID=33046 RepID=UPI001ABA730C|nr:Bgr_08870 family protein [Bartonella taylorii]